MFKSDITAIIAGASQPKSPWSPARAEEIVPSTKPNTTGRAATGAIARLEVRRTMGEIKCPNECGNAVVSIEYAFGIGYPGFSRSLRRRVEPGPGWRECLSWSSTNCSVGRLYCLYHHLSKLAAFGSWAPFRVLCVGLEIYNSSSSSSFPCC